MEILRFKENKYKRWYYQIINQSINRPITEYTEEHHILPKSLGGDDSVSNIVKLTAREHFICHWLLTKFTWGSDYGSMVYALRMMRVTNDSTKQRYNTPVTARVFERNKVEYANISSRRLLGENNPMYGKRHTEETKEKIRRANTGRKLTPEQRAKAISNRSGIRKPMTADSKANAWEVRRKTDTAYQYETVLTSRELFEYIMDTVHPKQFSSYVKRRTVLWAEIMEYTKQYIGVKDAERMYLWYYQYDPICALVGNKKSFGTFERGYKKFCGNQHVCACARNNQSTITKMTWETRPPEVQDAIRLKREETCLQKYGTRHALENEDVQAKCKRTLMETHGVETPGKSKVILEKAKKTNLERYGAEYVGGIPEFREKRKETCVKRYGVDNTMHIARATQNIKLDSEK